MMPFLAVAIAIAFVAMTLTILLIRLLRPFLIRYALARPNMRSSHGNPTPQGGGIAVLGGMFFSLIIAIFIVPMIWISMNEMMVLMAAVMILGIAGTIDDIKPLPILPRLLVQMICVAMVLSLLPDGDHILFAQVPGYIEYTVLFISLIWFINLCNFMDGIDWMTVAEFVPISVTLCFLFAWGGGNGQDAVAGVIFTQQEALIAASLCGAMIAFAYFNKPVAQLFLGDVGSLSLGLLLGYLLIILAVNGNFVAAIILPLYYFFDATITLLRRIWHKEPFWQAHRTHFYQRAMDKGLSVRQIVMRIFITNCALALLACLSVMLIKPIENILILMMSGLLVIYLLYDLIKERPPVEHLGSRH